MALANYKRVVEGRERALGPVHPATIEARDRLASAYHSLARRIHLAHALCNIAGTAS